MSLQCNLVTERGIWWHILPNLKQPERLLNGAIPPGTGGWVVPFNLFRLLVAHVRMPPAVEGGARGISTAILY